MAIRESRGRKAFLWINAMLLGLIAFCCFAPMLHVLCCSLSDPMVLAREGGFLLWPLGQWTLEGYRAVLSYANVLTGYMNTLLYVAAGLALNLALTVTAAYVLSRKRFAIRNGVMLFLSFTMLFNGGMIPNYILILNLGLLNTRWAVILPSAFSVFNLVVMRTSFAEIPDALEESARLDGANDLQIITRIIVPVSKATIAAIMLFATVAIWNSWFTASIYLTDRGKWPLQLFLREILISNSQRNIESNVKASVIASQMQIKYAIIIVATLPILCVYPFVQKYFVKGVMIGSIKG
ncbi:MAG: carbohydrate ABC transporter permease [Aristaeellaceae bacterium]